MNRVISTSRITISIPPNLSRRERRKLLNAVRLAHKRDCVHAAPCVTPDNLLDDHPNTPLSLRAAPAPHAHTGGLWSRLTCSLAPWWLCALAVLVGVLVAGVCWLAPVKADVLLYKLCLAPLGGLAMWLLDRALFAYAAPASYLRDDWRANPDADGGDQPDFPVCPGYNLVFCAAMLRQALFVIGGALAVSLGL